MHCTRTNPALHDSSQTLDLLDFTEVHLRLADAWTSYYYRFLFRNPKEPLINSEVPATQGRIAEM